MRLFEIQMRAAFHFGACLLLSGCFRNEVVDLGGDGGLPADTIPTDDTEAPSLRGVDIVVVVDNSGSMAEEQAILATSVFSLVNAFVSPAAGASYEAVDDLRIAVVSTDMGVSVDGHIPDEDVTPPSLSQYRNFGDDGAFFEMNVDSVDIESGVIPCDGEVSQCPPGWACADGSCSPADGGTAEVECPNNDEKIAELTPGGSADGLFATEVACLTALGTAGCGWEQQLGAAARATARADQATFFREGAALAVVLVSDEDDCSMADAESLFATEECQDATKLNIACGEHPEFLRDIGFYENAFAATKSGDDSAVFFAAIVGVPLVDACQGSGDAIAGCLLRDDMQLVPYIDSSSGADISKYTPACLREEGGAAVTSAVPGRRFVSLASAMGHNGYVFSICNDDWTDAMTAFAAIVAGALDN